MDAQLSRTDIAALSYAGAAIVFLALSLLLLCNWRARHQARILSLACVLTGLWATSMVSLAIDESTLPILGDVLEILRSGAWIIFLLLLLELPGARLKTLLIALIAISGLQLLASTLVGYGEYATQALMTVIGSRLILAVFGMLLVEQLYRNTPARERWGIKFACFGLGGLFAYDFYLYSDALLFRHINGEIWAARGIVNALIAPLLAVSASRNPAWALGLSVSRQMMFRSAALVGSAIYLLAMASSAYYIRYFGGAWGPVMQLVFLFGAVILLSGVLFSGTLRAKLKVLINKHFYKAIFDYRQEWLRFTRSLSEDGPDLGERTIQAVAELVESPAGALWIRREGGRCEPVASWNMAPQKGIALPNDAFCAFLESTQWVINLPECRQYPERYSSLALPEWLGSGLWLVVPLMLHGRLFGFVALARPRASIGLNWEVTDLLKIAGSQAASYLAHRESANSLTVARQFESFNRMSTFIVHDLKNLVFQLSLLLNNAKKHKNNPDFQQDMLGTLEHSVKKMTLLLQKLSRGEALDVAAPLLIEQLLTQAVLDKAAAKPAPVLEIEDQGLTVLANRARLERVLGHIIQNAIEATAQDGRVLVRLLRKEQTAVVELNDNGRGMSAAFMRERLFKPFESTKVAGMGIGVFESREYIREVGGQLEVVSEPAVGTTFRVILPLHVEAFAAAS
ncbi:MAG: putative PEP-CTERM system histidine kinase [Janthinobacterium sp.]|jgi:putative PEP-CTERM system histidine kinase